MTKIVVLLTIGVNNYMFFSFSLFVLIIVIKNTLKTRGYKKMEMVN